MQQLLWLEVALKGAAGLILIVLPFSALRTLGLDRPANRFWPRFSGFLLFGIAAGTLLSLASPSTKGGIGAGGLVALNLAAAAGLIVPLVWGTAAPDRRGRFLLAALTAALLALAFVEIAHI